MLPCGRCTPVGRCWPRRRHRHRPLDDRELSAGGTQVAEGRAGTEHEPWPVVLVDDAYVVVGASSQPRQLAVATGVCGRRGRGGGRGRVRARGCRQGSARRGCPPMPQPSIRQQPDCTVSSSTCTDRQSRRVPAFALGPVQLREVPLVLSAHGSLTVASHGLHGGCPSSRQGRDRARRPSRRPFM